MSAGQEDDPYTLMMKALQKDGSDSPQDQLKLEFEKGQSGPTVGIEKELELQAIANIRARNKMRRESNIFDGSEKKLSAREKQLLEEKKARELEE